MYLLNVTFITSHFYSSYFLSFPFPSQVDFIFFYFSVHFHIHSHTHTEKKSDYEHVAFFFFLPPAVCTVFLFLSLCRRVKSTFVCSIISLMTQGERCNVTSPPTLFSRKHTHTHDLLASYLTRWSHKIHCQLSHYYL